MCLCVEWGEMVLGSICFLSRLATCPPLLMLLCSHLQIRCPIPDLDTSSQLPLVQLLLSFQILLLLPPLLCYLCFKKSNMSFRMLPDSNQLKSPDGKKKKNPSIDCIRYSANPFPRKKQGIRGEEHQIQGIAEWGMGFLSLKTSFLEVGQSICFVQQISAKYHKSWKYSNSLTQ